MPNYIVLRLTPPTPVDPTTFANYLANLTIKVFDISYDNPNGQVAPASMRVTGASAAGSTVTLNGSFGASVNVGDPILVQNVGAGYDGVFVCIAPTNATTLTYVASGTLTATPTVRVSEISCL
jgi:hypothetical protein